MTKPPLTEAQAQEAVDAARATLAQALDTLREVRGEDADEPCRFCKGSGEATRYRETDEAKPCHFCKGSGRQRMSFPWIVTKVDWDTQTPAVKPSLFNRDTTWVSIRPCSKELGDKTYLGWLLGDIAMSQMARIQKDGTLEISMAMHNPAIFVPELGRIIYGCESWWGAIETPEDLRKITDADIDNVWYVKALKDLTSSPPTTDPT